MIDFEQGKKHFREGLSGRTGLVARCVNMLVRPTEEWESIRSENPSVERVVFGVLCVLALIPAVGRMPGESRFIPAFLTALTIYIALVGSISAAAWSVSRIAGRFRSEEDPARIFQWMVFAWIPLFIGGGFKYIPYLGWIEIAGWIYALYLLYLGSGILLKAPESKRLALVGLTVLIWAVYNALMATAVGNIIYLFR